LRQIVLDTETTGLDPKQGHRIIEIGCVELVNRQLTGNTYHQYIQPEREIDAGAMAVHGITNEFLADKPVFADIAEAFVSYIHGAELIIHNAPFDVGFMDAELGRIEKGGSKIADMCEVIDTLIMARRMHPGQKNNLDALCKRYMVNNAHRELHGALLDAEILSDVYLAMTGGQVALSLDGQADAGDSSGGGVQAHQNRPLSGTREPLPILVANDAELAAHEARLKQIDKASGGGCVWRSPEADH
jgi:DNA polymerase-3 subunit epsilon